MIEGPEFDSDFSYWLIDKCPELQFLEKGIPLEMFEEAVKQRKFEMEYRVLGRICQHKRQFNNLFRAPNTEFKNKNRFPELLTFMHNRVQLKQKESE